MRDCGCGDSERETDEEQDQFILPEVSAKTKEGKYHAFYTGLQQRLSKTGKTISGTDACGQ